MPPRIKAELLDDELLQALGEVGIRSADAYGVSWQDESGADHRVDMAADEYQRMLEEDVACALKGMLPVARSGVALRNQVAFPSQSSLVVIVATIPADWPDIGFDVERPVRASLWTYHFLRAQPEQREAAWFRGPAVLESTLESGVTQGGQEEPPKLVDWEALRAPLLSEDDEVRMNAATDCIAVLIVVVCGRVDPARHHRKPGVTGGCPSISLSSSSQAMVRH